MNVISGKLHQLLRGQSTDRHILSRGKHADDGRSKVLLTTMLNGIFNFGRKIRPECAFSASVLVPRYWSTIL